MLRSATFILLLGLAGTSATAQEPKLFAPRGLELDYPDESRVGVVRERVVNVDLSLLDVPPSVSEPAPRTLVLNLFANAEPRVRLQRAERLDGGFAWRGQVEGEPLSTVVLVTYHGALTGSVVWPGGVYRIRLDSRGSQVVEELDQSQFPDDGCVREVPPAWDDESPQGAGGEGDPVPMTDDGSIIEVLVAYTPAAREAEGGVAGILSMINTAITETNTGYSNSGVIQRLHLAGTVELNYTESDISTDLSRVTSTSDGYMDIIHLLRDKHYADEVVLIGDGYTSAGACGVAWLMSGNSPSFASHAFAVVDHQCATGYFSFGHELGHNMGLNHARVDPVGTGAYSYSYGYKDVMDSDNDTQPDYDFRTVMAYNCPVSCTRVLHFSNPNVTYGGKTTGIVETSPSSAYNALSLNSTRVTVANWRTSPTGTTPIDRYRLYHDGTKEHHYTTDAAEYAYLGTVGWVQEGVAHKVYTWTTPVSAVTPVPLLRLYHSAIQQHLWTTDSYEYSYLATQGWAQEGVDGYILPSEVSGTTTPLYRLAYAFLPLHLWTTDQNEYNTLPSMGWIQEGIAGHVVP
jgi:hypothetical protein